MKIKKKALIFGVTGQDGSYLADLLLKKKYQVFGVSRKKNYNKINLKKLNISSLKIFNINYENFNDVCNLIRKTKCSEIYYLSGQSSVYKSFFYPLQAYESNINGLVNILESCRIIKKKIRLYNACSSEIFGTNKKIIKFSESSPVFPVSPYALSKLVGLRVAKSYREMFGVQVSSGILFNHESPLRSKKFIIKKIIDSVKNIIKNKNSSLKVGNINIYRDWGWAPDYVYAMWLILQKKKPKDFIIGSGKLTSLRHILKYCFNKKKLKWTKHVKIDKSLCRVHEIKKISANYTLAKKELNWKPTKNIYQILDNIFDNKYY
jgi:GDPmannose 4,6-dehydratase